MPQYELSKTYYFRENGQKLEPGDTVELTEEQAALHNHNNPGLLKAVRLTTQATVPVRSQVTPVAKVTKKKRAPRARS